MKTLRSILFLGLIASTSRAEANELQTRIDAAAPGTTLEIPPGVHRGSIVIDKPLTLVGVDLPEIRGPGQGKVVRITAAGVTLRGFRITGSGLSLFDDDAAIHVTANRATIEENLIEDSLHGIYLKKVSGCRILHNQIRGKTLLTVPTNSIEQDLGRAPENCDPETLVANRRGNGIHQWNSEETLISGNEISDTRDGIYFSFTNHCRVEHNSIHQARYGLHYMYSNDNTFENNSFSDNAAGAAIMFSQGLSVRHNQFVNNRGLRAYGLIFQSTDRSVLEGNDIQRNAVGLSFNQCNGNRVIGNRLTQNYIGLRFGSNSEGNQFSENAFVKNLHPVEVGGETTGNQWAIDGVGNLWSDAVPLDLDGDGIIDLPHRELDLFGLLRREFPPIALLSESPGVKLLRFAHDRAALPGTSSVEDPAPLTNRFWKLRAQRAAQAARGITPTAVSP